MGENKAMRKEFTSEAEKALNRAAKAEQQAIEILNGKFQGI